jgi:Cys-tRNA(Pro)/Cys-tRNA(Cys) deacylase
VKQGTPALVALTRAGIAHRTHAYDPPGDHAHYGEAGAAALGVDPVRMAKTLVAEVDGRLHVAVVPVSGSLDLKALAHAVGGKRSTMAEAAAAERATGYVVGGISPLGHRTRLPVVVDADLLVHESVFVSAGRRGLSVELTPADLVTATGATVASIGKAD